EDRKGDRAAPHDPAVPIDVHGLADRDVGHDAVPPDKRVRLAVRLLAPADDLAKGVDTIRAAVAAGERPQAGHGTVFPEKGTLRARAYGRPADDPAAGGGEGGRAVRSAECAEVRDCPAFPAIGPRGEPSTEGTHDTTLAVDSVGGAVADQVARPL